MHPLTFWNRSLIVEHLDAQTESLSCGLAYIYCDFNKRETQTPFILLSSMLEQLLRQLGGDSIPPEVTTLYELHKKHDTRPALAEIVNVLRRVCQCSDAVRVIIDALDECSPSEEAALDVVSAVLDLGSTVRLLCTSRPSMIFGSYFRGLDAKVVEIAAQSDDIRTFIEANIPRQPRLVRHVRSDPSLKEDIVAAIIEQSRGMYGALLLKNADSSQLTKIEPGSSSQPYISSLCHERSAVVRFAILWPHCRRP